MTKEKKKIKDNQKYQFEFLRMYYEHQYDRIAKLEDHSISITNIVLTISIAALAFGFDTNNLNPITGFALPLAIIFANLFAIAYLLRTNGFTRVHTQRAKTALENFAPEIYSLDKSLPFRYIRMWGLEKIVLYIHILLVIISLLPIFLYI